MCDAKDNTFDNDALYCPFCHSDRIMWSQDDSLYFVVCTNCGGKGGLAATLHDAVKKWNRRGF